MDRKSNPRRDQKYGREDKKEARMSLRSWLRAYVTAGWSIRIEESSARKRKGRT